MDTEPKRL